MSENYRGQPPDSSMKPFLKRSATILLGACLLVMVLADCAVSPTETPLSETSQSGASQTVDPTAPPVCVQPVLYGTWMDGNKQMLVISEKSLYLVEVVGEGENAQVRESFYELQEVDWARDVLTLHLDWVRVNGQFGGFDIPLHYMKISIDGDQLWYSMGDETQGIPAEVAIGPWLRQE